MGFLKNGSSKGNKDKKNNNEKTALSTTYYCIGVVWLVLGASQCFGHSSSTGTTFIAIGAMWLCIGVAYFKKEKNQKTTLDYYNENAAQFVEHTVDADMSETRNRFLSNIPENGYVLDFGCGSGRDTKAFRDAGYQVDATDASEELCKMATEYSGVEVSNKTFLELDEKEKYDGIFACASLLHAENDSLDDILALCHRALKVNGVMYLSFKYGNEEGVRNGRFFNDMNEEKFAKHLKKNKKLQLEEQWVTGDVRDGRESEKWFNAIISRVK